MMMTQVFAAVKAVTDYIFIEEDTHDASAHPLELSLQGQPQASTDKAERVSLADCSQCSGLWLDRISPGSEWCQMPTCTMFLQASNCGFTRSQAAKGFADLQVCQCLVCTCSILVSSSDSWLPTLSGDAMLRSARASRLETPDTRLAILHMILHNLSIAS